MVDMFCTPPATTRSWVPDMTPCAAKCTACWDEPHWRSIVVPGTSSGSPAASQQVRATSPACGPIVSTQPNTTSSTAAGSIAGAVHQRVEHVGTQVGRVHLGQTAAAATDGRANGVDDVGLGHGDLPGPATARCAGQRA